jgi:guanylate cyclase
MIMMEKYTYNLEGIVQERTDQLVEQKKKIETLLHRVLPKYLHISLNFLFYFVIIYCIFF